MKSPPIRVISVYPNTAALCLAPKSSSIIAGSVGTYRAVLGRLRAFAINGNSRKEEGKIIPPKAMQILGTVATVDTIRGIATYLWVYGESGMLIHVPILVGVCKSNLKISRLCHRVCPCGLSMPSPPDSLDLLPRDSSVDSMEGKEEFGVLIFWNKTSSR